MVININVQYNGGHLPDIILLTQGYYHWETHLMFLAPGHNRHCAGKSEAAVAHCADHFGIATNRLNIGNIGA